MLGDSLKDNIAYEISELKKQDADILGMLVLNRKGMVAYSYLLDHDRPDCGFCIPVDTEQ